MCLFPYNSGAACQGLTADTGRQEGAFWGALGTRAHKSRVAAELHSVVKPQPGQKSKKNERS